MYYLWDLDSLSRCMIWTSIWALSLVGSKSRHKLSLFIGLDKMRDKIPTHTIQTDLISKIYSISPKNFFQPERARETRGRWITWVILWQVKVGRPKPQARFDWMISSDFMIDFCGFVIDFCWFLLISKQGVRDFFRCGPLDLDTARFIELLQVCSPF